MQIPPDTSNAYMALGYLVIVLLLAGMIIFQISRSRKLRHDIALLTTAEDESSPDSHSA